MTRLSAYTPNDVAVTPNDPACGAMPWHVVQSEPSHEFAALNAISALPGVRGYLPLEVTTRAKMRHGRPVIEDGRRVIEQAFHPFFRGYLFAQFDPDAPHWPHIARARGVKRIMCTARNWPIPVPRGFVERLQARGRAGDGAIDLAAPAPLLAPGTKVRLPDGPFADLDAVVAATAGDRVAVMLGMLRVTVERAALEVVG